LLDLRLAIRLGTLRRIPDGDLLGIAFEPASHDWFLLSPASAPAAGRASCCFHSRATFSRGPLNSNWRSLRRFLDARAERAARHDTRSGRRRRWHDVLAKRTPPIKAAAKRRSQAALGCGVRPRRGVYGALVGRLTAEMPLLDWLVDGGDSRISDHLESSDRFTGLTSHGLCCGLLLSGKRSFSERAPSRE
jgi:hypothetical protein